MKLRQFFASFVFNSKSLKKSKIIYFFIKKIFEQKLTLSININNVTIQRSAFLVNN